MSAISLRNGELFAEGVALSRIAKRFGTPCFVYSRAALEQAYRNYDQAFGRRPHLICYAMKANSNLAILNLFARMGSGFDIVSGGELAHLIEMNHSRRFWKLVASICPHYREACSELNRMGLYYMDI